MRTLAEPQARYLPEFHTLLHHLHHRQPKSSALDWGPCFTDLCWLGQGTRVAAASLDGQGMWFDTERGEHGTLVSAKKTRESLFAVASTTDGSRIAFGGSGRGVLGQGRW